MSIRRSAAFLGVAALMVAACSSTGSSSAPSAAASAAAPSAAAQHEGPASPAQRRGRLHRRRVVEQLPAAALGGP